MLRCYHVRMRILSKLLRPFCAAVLATGLSGCTTASTVNETVSIAPENPVVETEYVFEPISALAAVNAARIHHRVSAVEEDDRLMQAARTHADLMGRTGKYGHEIGPGTKFKSRIFAVGFVNSAGENIGVGYRNVDQFARTQKDPAKEEIQCGWHCICPEHVRPQQEV